MAEKNKKLIVKNYIYNASYQLLAIIIPLVTTPYVSRVLHASGVGQASFVNSIASYFLVFGALGFVLYGQREIASHQDDKVEQSKIFWEIVISKLISTVIVTAVFIGIILGNVFGDVYSSLMWILLCSVTSTAFDITFLYQGNEKFRIIAIRNAIIKIAAMVLIFVFVKKEEDVWIYILCNSGALLISNISLWVTLPKMLVKTKIRDLNIKRHILPSLKLFLPTLAISVYTMIDKTLIGLMIPGTTEVIDETGETVIRNISDIENGYYNQSEQIVKMATTIIAALGTVMISRNSDQVSSGDLEGFKKNIYNAMRFTMFIGMPIMFGLVAIAQNFSAWFFGPGYEKVPYLIMMFSPLVLILGVSNVLGIQYLLPLKRDNKYTIAIIIGCLTNIALNLVLIPFLWSYGACIATLASELLVTVLMFIFARKDVSWKKVFFSNGWKYIVAGAVMFGAVFATQYFLPSKIHFTLILIFEGIVIYFIMLLILKESLLLSIIAKVKNKLSKKKEIEGDK